jgi:hypothetical protein
VVLHKGVGLRGLDYFQIGHIPLKEGFSAKGFLFKHVRVRC